MFCPKHTPSLRQGNPSSEEDGWVIWTTTNKERRLLGALFLTFWNLANFPIVVSNLATVDVQGVILSWPTVYFDSMNWSCKFHASQEHCVVMCYHIGVGSNVVCLTTMGDARASGRGTDDRQFPRFFIKHTPVI